MADTLVLLLSPNPAMCGFRAAGICWEFSCSAATHTDTNTFLWAQLRPCRKSTPCVCSIWSNARYTNNVHGHFSLELTLVFVCKVHADPADCRLQCAQQQCAEQSPVWSMCWMCSVHGHFHWSSIACVSSLSPVRPVSWSSSFLCYKLFILCMCAIPLFSGESQHGLDALMKHASAKISNYCLISPARKNTNTAASFNVTAVIIP